MKMTVEGGQKGQRRARHDFVSGRDVFVLLPTGYIYGKWFCYALCLLYSTIFARAWEHQL